MGDLKLVKEFQVMSGWKDLNRWEYDAIIRDDRIGIDGETLVFRGSPF